MLKKIAWQFATIIWQYATVGVFLEENIFVFASNFVI